MVFARTRWNLTLWYALVMGFVLLLTAATFLAVVHVAEEQAVDRTLETLVNSTLGRESREHLAERGFSISLGGLRHSDFQEDLEHTIPEHTYLRWYTREGKLSWQGGEAAARVPRDTLRPGYATLSGTQGHYRQLTLRLPGGFLQMGKKEEELVHGVLVGILLAFPVLLGITGGCAWLLAGRAMVPIVESYRRLQQFTGDASHELRTPVATILATAQGALHQPEVLSPDTYEKFAVIVQTAQRMKDLTEDLLWLARIDSGVPVGRICCSLHTILTDLHEELAPLSVAKAQDFQIRLPPGEIHLVGQQSQLYRLFTNLITNAIKYTPVGGRIEVRVERSGDGVAVQVVDTGVGIPAAHLGHLFERFYRVDEARTREAGGFGLGLAIAQTIVKHHQGTISVQSTAGAGSTFTIHLPLGRS
ncbi:sensor histidine kinase [Anthocerotibacter panamensis]|uniref:sensor histidine kinase n=1 Tax=Anthocerotibacter panamensis TaxID=2857077 RepID=UPI001C401F40|nr:ATP-binding protein [Anthocerotibacter panamensis]